MSRKVVTPPQRKFLGKTENFDSKEERSFHQRMLKAYLKGYVLFRFGRYANGQPKYYNVLQQPV